MTVKIVPDMTYNVFGGTLNLAHSLTQLFTTFCRDQLTCRATDGWTD